MGASRVQLSGLVSIAEGDGLSLCGVKHVNSKGLKEPRWNRPIYLLPVLAKMTVSSFGSPESYANLEGVGGRIVRLA